MPVVTRIRDAFDRIVRWADLRRPVPQPDRFGAWRVAPERVSQGITPPIITRILCEADEGWPHRQAELFAEAISKDPRLAGVISTRTKTPATLDWDLVPASDEPRDIEVAEWLREKLRVLALRQPLARLGQAVAYGYAAEQILWEERAGEVIVRELRAWPTRYLMPDASGRITRIVTAENPTPLEMEPGRFIVHTPGDLGEDPVTAGLMRAGVWFWFFKNHTLKGWLEYSELYAQPMRVGHFAAGTSKEDRDKVFNMLVNMGRRAVAVVPESMRVELHQAAQANAGPDVYERLANRCDEELAVLFLGQTLTTAVGPKGGSYAAAQVHDQVRQDLVQWDACGLAETLTRDLVTPWVRFQFGPDTPSPQFVLAADPPVDLKARAETLKVLSVELGLGLGEDWVRTEFAVPQPEAGERVLVGGKQVEEGAQPDAGADDDDAPPDNNDDASGDADDEVAGGDDDEELRNHRCSEEVETFAQGKAGRPGATRPTDWTTW